MGVGEGGEEGEGEEKEREDREGRRRRRGIHSSFRSLMSLSFSLFFEVHFSMSRSVFVRLYRRVLRR